MSILSSLFKKKKPSLAPDITPLMPVQINPKKYGELSDLSTRLIGGPGFSEGFADKTTSPVAESMRRNFRNVTSPFISNQYSARGLGRSNLAADAQGKAEGDVESNIGNLFAQMFHLNEVQKKADTQFGANLGRNILSGDVNQHNVQAEASERLAKATAAQQHKFQDQDRQMAGNIVTAGAQLLAPGLGKAFQPQGVQSALQQLGVPGVRGAISPVKTQTLGDFSPGNLDKLNIEDLLALFGG